MNDAALRRLVQEQSPWRVQPAGWEQDDPDVRASLRVALDYEPDPLADTKRPACTCCGVPGG